MTRLFPGKTPRELRALLDEGEVEEMLYARWVTETAKIGPQLGNIATQKSVTETQREAFAELLKAVRDAGLSTDLLRPRQRQNSTVAANEVTEASQLVGLFSALAAEPG